MATLLEDVGHEGANEDAPVSTRLAVHHQEYIVARQHVLKTPVFSSCIIWWNFLPSMVRRKLSMCCPQ
eukprot:4462200-Amphidinium_carterae.2